MYVSVARSVQGTVLYSCCKGKITNSIATNLQNVLQRPLYMCENITLCERGTLPLLLTFLVFSRYTHVQTIKSEILPSAKLKMFHFPRFQPSAPGETTRADSVISTTETAPENKPEPVFPVFDSLPPLPPADEEETEEVIRDAEQRSLNRRPLNRRTRKSSVTCKL